MSYILDALKKAESERKLGSVPNVYMEPLPIAQSDEPVPVFHRPWVWITAVILVAVGLAAAGVKMWQGEAPPASAPIAVRQPSMPAPVLESKPQLAAVTQEPPPLPTPAPKKEKASKDVTSTNKKAVAAANQPKPLTPAKTAVESVREKPANAVVHSEPEKSEKAQAKLPSQRAPSSPQTVDTQVAALRELPEHIQRTIPPISVGGYIYSPNPAERSMLLNSRLVREGEQTASGLTLEKMMPKEAILNYQGQRFRLPY